MLRTTLDLLLTVIVAITGLTILWALLDAVDHDRVAPLLLALIGY